MQAAAAEAQPAAKAAEPAAEALESPSQMAASDRIEDSDKEGAAKAPQPIASGILQRLFCTICYVIEQLSKMHGLYTGTARVYICLMVHVPSQSSFLQPSLLSLILHSGLAV